MRFLKWLLGEEFFGCWQELQDMTEARDALRGVVAELTLQRDRLAIEKEDLQGNVLVLQRQETIRESLISVLRDELRKVKASR